MHLASWVHGGSVGSLVDVLEQEMQRKEERIGEWGERNEALAE
jgi:hypothetical protein